MFQTIINRQTAPLHRLGEQFRIAGRDFLALLCFEHAFREPPQFHNWPISDVAEILWAFLGYARLMMNVTRKSLDDPGLQQLFGLQAMSDNIFSMPDTPFHRRLLSDRAITIPMQNDRIRLHEWELSSQFKHCLNEHLWQQVHHQDRICKQTRVFRPCLRFLLENYCAQEDRCWRAHLQASALTRDFYNLRVCIHLQQIMILQTQHFNSRERDNRVRWVLSRASAPLCVTRYMSFAVTG
jgi:hypothetical protein